jgi:hypothetical protein
MDMHTVSIRDPETFHIVDEAGLSSQGCDQDWFGSEWQRASGCGPTAASGILYYLHRTGRIRLPFTVDRKSDCVTLMERVWRHVTPTANGVDTLERFCDGVVGFTRAMGSELACRTLEVPKKKGGRAPVDELVRFVAAGLSSDCPVAFLNLSSGRVRKLESWHWMTLLALRTGPGPERVEGLVTDGAASTWVDLAKWHATTALGGGFVYFEAAGPGTGEKG